MTNATNKTNTKARKTRNNIAVTTAETVLAGIASKHLWIETLAERKRDGLDFHEVSVVAVRKALQAAYEAGLNAVRTAANAAPTAIPATDAATMVSAIRENLSAEAVTSIVAHTQGASTNDPEVDGQVRWFVGELINLLGGHDACGRLMNELGL